MAYRESLKANFIICCNSAYKKDPRKDERAHKRFPCVIIEQIPGGHLDARTQKWAMEHSLTCVAAEQRSIRQR